MRDQWTADTIALIKWSVLHELAHRFDVARILQIAYYRPSETAPINFDGNIVDVSRPIRSHFRDIRNVAALQSDVRVIEGGAEAIAKLFSIRRPLRSSKLLRMPTRGTRP